MFHVKPRATRVDTRRTVAIVSRVDPWYDAAMKNPLIAARIPPDVRERIDRCAEAATTAAGLGARPFERGDVVRLLVLRALPGYEAELGCKPTKTSSATKKPTTTKPKAKIAKRGKR